MGNKIHNAKFKASQKSGVCCKCNKTFKSKELQYYIDGCNYAITNNSKPVCIYCKPPKYIEMTEYTELNKLMLSMGFKFVDGKFENDKCAVEIVDDKYYAVKRFDNNLFCYSENLQIYWLIGFFMFHGLAGYKRYT